MTRDEYLIELAKKLQAIPMDREELYPEIRRLVGFYQEMIEDRIEDGLTEEDAVAGMEKIEDIVERARRELAMPEIVVGGAENAAPASEPQVKARADGRFTYMTKSFPGMDLGRVSIADQNRAVRVVTGEALKVEYVDGPDGHYDIDTSGGNLTVRFIPENWGLRMIFGGWKSQDTTFTLTLPRSFKGEADVRTSNSSITVTSVAVEKSLVLRTSNGKITAESVSAERVKFVTANGGIRLSDVAANSVTAQSSNAKIESERVEGDEITLTTCNGGNEAHSVAGRVVHIQTSNGHLSVDRVAGDDITLVSSNGAITGVISGRAEDYAITSRTSNGKNNLPAASAGKKKLNVRTSNARIDISFEK